MGCPEVLHGCGWTRWMLAAFGQRLRKGPSEQCQSWKFWKTHLEKLEGPRWCPAWVVCLSFQAFHHPPDHAAKQPSGSPVLVSRHCSSEPSAIPSSPCLSTALLMKSAALQLRPIAARQHKRSSYPILGQVSILFSVLNHISALQSAVFSLKFAWLLPRASQTQRALTNPVYHLRRFCFLNNCKFLILGLDWQTGSAFFFLHKRTAVDMDGLSATAVKICPLCLSCTVPFIITAHHGAVTSAAYTSEHSQIQAHPADAELNFGFWRHTYTQLFLKQSVLRAVTCMDFMPKEKKSF